MTPGEKSFVSDKSRRRWDGGTHFTAQVTLCEHEVAFLLDK
jgi:hypothetical protein